MDGSPMLRAVLAELLALNDEDAQLPVPVLVNLHRPQLRVPLQRATTLGNEERDGSLHEAVLKVGRELDAWYPSLREGDLFKVTRLTAVRYELLAEPMPQPPPPGPHRILLQLLGAAAGGWNIHDPLAQLYRMSLPGADLNARTWLLEQELQLDPAVREMILTCQGL